MVVSVVPVTVVVLVIFDAPTLRRFDINELRLFEFSRLWTEVVNLGLCPVMVVAPHDQCSENNDADETLHDGTALSKSYH